MTKFLLVLMLFAPSVVLASDYYTMEASISGSNVSDPNALITELTRRLLYKQEFAAQLLEKAQRLETSNAELIAELRQKNEEIAQLHSEIERRREARSQYVSARSSLPTSAVQQPQYQAAIGPARLQGQWVVYSRQNLVRAGYWTRVYAPDTYIPLYDCYNRRIGTRVSRNWRDSFIPPEFETVYYRKWQQN
jgi:hypothetical protein